MIIKNVNLETVIGITSKLPQNEKCEIAFAGRSNVGKSSLINALVNRKSYARTSSEPGKTQTINFYRVQYLTDDRAKELDFYLTDLPGYGYARVSAEERGKWGTMINRYLSSSKALKAVILLVDIRHAPTKDDVQMMEWMRGAGFTPAVIATKLDKLNRSEAAKQTRIIRTALGLGPADPFFAFSATTKAGRDDILRYIEGVVTEEEE